MPIPFFSPQQLPNFNANDPQSILQLMLSLNPDQAQSLAQSQNTAQNQGQYASQGEGFDLQNSQMGESPGSPGTPGTSPGSNNGQFNGSGVGPISPSMPPGGTWPGGLAPGLNNNPQGLGSTLTGSPGMPSAGGTLGGGGSFGSPGPSGGQPGGNSSTTLIGGPTNYYGGTSFGSNPFGGGMAGYPGGPVPNQGYDTPLPPNGGWNGGSQAASPDDGSTLTAGQDLYGGGMTGQLGEGQGYDPGSYTGYETGTIPFPRNPGDGMTGGTSPTSPSTPPSAPPTQPLSGMFGPSSAQMYSNSLPQSPMLSALGPMGMATRGGPSRPTLPGGGSTGTPSRPIMGLGRPTSPGGMPPARPVNPGPNYGVIGAPTRPMGPVATPGAGIGASGPPQATNPGIVGPDGNGAEITNPNYNQYGVWSGSNTKLPPPPIQGVPGYNGAPQGTNGGSGFGSFNAGSSPGMGTGLLGAMGSNTPVGSSLGAPASAGINTGVSGANYSGAQPSRSQPPAPSGGYSGPSGSFHTTTRGTPGTPGAGAPPSSPGQSVSPMTGGGGTLTNTMSGGSGATPGSQFQQSSNQSYNYNQGQGSNQGSSQGTSNSASASTSGEAAKINQLGQYATMLTPQIYHQNRFNTGAAEYGNQSGKVTGGEQVGNEPAINTGPVWNDQQVNQQVNALRGTNDAATANQFRAAQSGLASHGYGQNSPLMAALGAQYQGQNLAANTAGERDLRWNAAQGNAQQLLNSQQARNAQFAQRQQEQIGRAGITQQGHNALFSALMGAT